MINHAPGSGPLEIVEARPTDAVRIAGLFAEYLAFYGRHPNAGDQESFLRDRLARSESVIFIALDASSDPVGFVQLYPSWSSLSLKRVWILNDLFVAQASRKHGVGELLMQRAKQLAHDTGAKGLLLQTGIDNHAARHLYEKLGWKADRDFMVYELDL